MEEVRFIRCTREQYDKLMNKNSSAFYVTDEKKTEEVVQEEDVQQQN
jgi:hypothetical protein